MEKKTVMGVPHSLTMARVEEKKLDQRLHVCSCVCPQDPSLAMHVSSYEAAALNKDRFTRWLQCKQAQKALGWLKTLNVDY